MSSPVVAAVNAVLDLVPRQTVHVGARGLPAFRSIGIVGYHVALLVAMVTGLRAGVPLLDVLGLSAAAALSFFAWAVLRRAVTGRRWGRSPSTSPPSAGPSPRGSTFWPWACAPSWPPGGSAA